MQVLLNAGMSIVSIAAQCRQGYLRAAALVEATDGLKLVGDYFLPSFEPPIDHLSYCVPYTSDGVHKELTRGVDFPSLKHPDKEFFQELLKAFVCYH